LIACNKDDDFVPSAKVDKESLQLTYSGGVDSFAITSNTDWKVEKDADWITTLLPASGNGNAVIKVTVAESAVTTPRSATITVKGDDFAEIKITVNQGSAPEPKAGVDKQSLQFTYSVGIDSFAITSNVNWTIEVEEDADWITLLPASGNGDAVIKVTVAENTVPTPRSATITVKAAGFADIGIAVTQSKALETVGLYILSEGYTGNPDNTGSISYYNVKTGELTKNYFSRADGKPLGDGVNDLAIYGSNLYCVVMGGYAGTPGTEGYIEVINPENGISKKRIPVTKADGTNGEPRRIVFHEGKAYVSTYSNSVIRIDTASLEIDYTIPLTGGTYAEDLCLYNNNLYICNSGWGFGNTISVVNLNSFSEETITVPQNPIEIEITPSGVVYFATADASWAGGDPSNLYMLDLEQKQVSHAFNISASKIALAKDFIYATTITDWTNYTCSINKINLQTKTGEDISDIVHDYFGAYSVSVNPLNEDIYVGGAGQDAVVFDKDLSEKVSLKTGKAFTIKVVPIIK
jgi:hypothetical protein